MSRPMKLVLAALAAVSAFVLAAGLLIGDRTGYARVIRSNWGIDLPRDAYVVYERESDGGIFGDNDRFHVFLCPKGVAELTDFQDPGALSGGDADEVARILGKGAEDGVSGLNVPHSEWPDLLKCTWTRWQSAEDPRNCMYLFWNAKRGRLYVLERFF